MIIDNDEKRTKQKKFGGLCNFDCGMSEWTIWIRKLCQK